MLSREKVINLATLARLAVSDEEIGTLEKEILAILSFVDTIQKAPVGEEDMVPMLRNVMRPDEEEHESGVYTEMLLAAAPEEKDGRVVVKQVISRNTKL